MNVKKEIVSLLTVPVAMAIGSGNVWAQISAQADTITEEKVIAPQSSDYPNVWTFDDCLNWALANNTDIRRTMLNVLTARQDILSAKDAWLPTVDFATSQSLTNYPVKESGRTANTYGSSYNVGASWTVWDGNIRSYRGETAKLLQQQQLLTGDDVVKTLKLGILEAYLDIMYADEAIKIAQQTLEVSTSQAERAQKLTEAGRMSRVECAQIESQRAQDEYSLTIAKSNYENSKLALKKILALGLNYDLKVENLIFPDSEILNQLPNSADVYALALEWLPQFKSNAISKSIYDNDVKIARAGRMPSIALQGNIGTGYSSGASSGWGTTMGRNLNENIGVSVKVPIFDGNSTKRAVAKAKLAALDYDITQKELTDNLSQTIEGLYINATNAQAKYRAGLSQLTAVEMTDQLVNRQFELGYVAPLDLLTAHNDLLNARLELLQSKYMALLAAKTINYYATQQIELK